MTAIQQKKADILSETNYRLLSGGLSGIVSRSSVAPIERIIILRQTNDKHYSGLNIFKTIRQMLKNEGPQGLFKGNLANCFRIGPFQAIEFYTFDLLKKQYLPQAEIYLGQHLSLLISGAVAGALAFSLVYPFDLTKTILAIQYNKQTEYKGILRTMSRIVQKNGILGLWQGMSAALVGITPYSSLKLTFFQVIKDQEKKILQQKKSNDVRNMFYGGLAGCMALTITYPTDVIRRRLQIQILSDLQRKSYIETMKEMYRTQGMRVFYCGLVATYLKVIPSTAIAFTINEKFKRVRNLN